MPDWGWFVATTVAAGLGLFAAIHAIRNKRDPRTALMWVSIVLLSPFVGALLYCLFGINRNRKLHRCHNGLAVGGQTRCHQTPTLI